MGKEHLQDVTVETLRPKDHKWKMGARLRYLKEKKYQSNGVEKKLLTGVLEGSEKQIKFNVWSSKMAVEAFTPNATYQFSNGKLTEQGVINFGEYSDIQRSVDTGIFPLYKLYRIHQLQQLGNTEKIIDFQAHIKDVSQIHTVLSKAPSTKTYQRQLITCCDPSTHFTVTVTMWDNFLSNHSIGYKCLFTGFKHKIYCESRQLNSTVFSKISCELTQERLVMDDEEEEGWTQLSLLYRPRTLREVRQKLEATKVGEVVYSKVVLRFGEFAAEECYQEMCFGCNAKVEQEQETGRKYCPNCKTEVAVGNRRLFLRFFASDGTADIKIKIYNYSSEKLLQLLQVKESVEELMKMGRKELNQVFLPLCSKDLQVTLTSNIVIYEDTQYESHSLKDITLL